MTKTNTRSRIVSILLSLVMLLSLLPTTAFAAGSAETKTTDVTDYGSLETAMSDKTTDVVRLTSDITLRDDFDTKIFIEMSKTLDFNGFTLTIPENQRLQLIYKNSLDLKFINSSSSKTAKLKILTHGTNPIYNEIMNSEYTVNFEIDGVDVEYEKDYETFWTYAGDNGFNNLVFKNLKITGFHTLTYNGDGKTIKFSNVTKASNNSPIQQFLINSSALTVDDIIDANSVIEYYPSGGVKVTADRTATLDTINGYWGPITVKFANSINEIRLVGDVQNGNVPAGILPSFNPGTTTDSITINKMNSGWEYKMESGGWSGFGLETPVAYNDGKTNYGYDFCVKTNDGYQLDYSNLKVFYNDVEVTSSVRVLKYAWGAYVTVDLGKAIGENPTTHTVTFNSNGGTEIAPKEVVSGLKIKAPSTPTKDKYLFRGWYEDSTFNKEFDFNTPITSDITLYAKWEAANSINEIRLAGDIQYGNVPVGTLPSFNPATTTDSITIDKTNSDWQYKMESGGWSGFGSKTPVAYNDGKTDYGYDFCVKTNDGYQLDYSNLKVFYNDVEVTSSVRVLKYAWGAYVTVDLGKAIGTPVVYTITFNSNDGTSVESQNVNAGEKLTEPTPAPTKEGFTFDGWYEDSTFSTKFNFDTPITDNMTLYAKWTENKYTLTFDANGGSGTMTPVTDLTGEYTLPANGFTAPSGKQFKGWSLTTDGAIVTKVDMTENRTVYAIWENIPVVTYTVSFAANGGTGTMADVTGISGEYTLPANGFTAPAGKQFKAWSVGGVEKVVGDKITVTANTTVTAVWEAIEYNVTVTGGTAYVGAGTPITKATMGTTVTLTAGAAPSGKVFDKWEVVSGGITLADANSATTTFTMPAGAVSVKATYTTYITVNLAAGEGSGTMEPIIIKNTYGYFSLTAPECTFTAPANKVFDKWQFSKDDSYLKPGDTKTIWSSADGATLTAIWKDAPVTEYDITVTDGKATVGAGTEITKAAEGTTVTLTANAAPTDMVFDKWEVISGSITLADANSATTTFTMPAGAVSVKATYTTYITVNLAAGEGSGTMEPIIIKNTYGYFSLTAPECIFTAPANKVFDKWQSSKDDSYLKPGDTKTIWSSADGATLTAIWKDAPVTEYDITVTDGKATIGAGSEISKAAEGTAVTLTANAAPSGKVFDKWEVVSGGITLADANSATTTFTMPAEAVSVKATYKNAPHTHTYNQETVKPEALKTPADCTSNAVYFKSCSCGAISTTDTFVAMNTALGHAYGSDWKYDSTNHWHECSRCHDKKDEAAHDYGPDNVCDTCGYDKTVPHTHNLTLVAAKAATCTKGGKKAYYKCEGCGKFYEDVLGTKKITDLASWGNIAKIAHTTKQTVTKATPTANGKIVNYCSVCKKTLSTTVIPKASSIKLKATSLTYNGKVRTPKVIVKDRTGKTLVKNTDYTVSYAKGRKYVGKYAVKITFKGKYSGTKTLYFTIKPKATSISSLKAGSKKFTVKWKKQATQTTGYQVQYSASSKFSKAKTVTVGKNKTVSKKISKLSGKKKYYVRVRTYKTVKINGKSIRIYSGWSKAKTVTTKK